MKNTLIAVLSICCALIASAQTTPPPWEEDYDHWHDHEFGDDPQSPGAITEGNPVTSTTMIASEAATGTAFISTEAVTTDFSDDGDPDVTPTQRESSAEASAGGSTAAIDIDIGTGSAKIDGMDVDFYTFRLPYSRPLGDRGTLHIHLPVSVTNLKDVLLGDGTIGDAKVYGGGLNVGYTHKVFMKQDGKPYRWNVSPTAGFYLRESSDLNQGAWVYNLGISSSFAYRLSENWVINIGNSASFAWNNGRKDFPDPIRDNQQVFINGLQVFYLAGRWTPYAYVMDTRFARSALIDNFQTYGLGLGFKITRNRSLKATVIYEDGKSYEAWRATVGTSWKF